jgi:hypothetical protein
MSTSSLQSNDQKMLSPSQSPNNNEMDYAERQKENDIGIIPITPSGSTIDCTKTNIPSQCLWNSPSKNDRSNPMIGMVCPIDKTGMQQDMCWMDFSPNTPRQFKCGACNISNHSQTETCHITMTASANKDTSKWELNMTDTYSNRCKNKWFKM